MIISGFFSCTCGKNHSLADVNITSQCTCGAFLYPQVSTEATQRVAAVLVKMSR